MQKKPALSIEVTLSSFFAVIRMNKIGGTPKMGGGRIDSKLSSLGVDIHAMELKLTGYVRC